MTFDHGELMRALKLLRDVKDGQIYYRDGYMTAMGGSMMARVALEAKDAEDIDLPEGALKFLDTLRVGPVTLEPKEGALLVRQGKAKAKFTLPADARRELPDVEDGSAMRLPAGAKALLEAAQSAVAAKVEVGNVIGCIHLWAAGGKLCAEAMDGFFAIRASLPCEGEADLLLTAEAAKKLCQLMGDGPADVTTDGRRAKLEGEGWTLLCALHVGKYVDMGRIVYMGSKGARLCYQTADVRDAAQQAAIARTRTGATRLHFAAGELRVRSQNEQCEYAGTLEEATGADIDLQMAVDCNYLARAVAGVKTEQIDLLTSSTLLMVSAPMEGGGRYEALVLPVRQKP